MTVEAFGTGVAAVVASFTGVAAYFANRRSKRVEEALAQTDKTAELARTEVEGWKALIDSLLKQYKDSTEEAILLRKRLADGNLRFETMSVELTQARIDHAEGLAIIKRLEAEVKRLSADLHSATLDRDERIHTLREAVAKLGGDVDRINNHGKTGERGPIGDQGPIGERGPPGDHG